jgi:hypothetical protein
MSDALRNMHPEHHQNTSVFTLWLDSSVQQPTTSKPLHSKIHFIYTATPIKIDSATLGMAEFYRQSNINKTMTIPEHVLISDQHSLYRLSPSRNS